MPVSPVSASSSELQGFLFKPLKYLNVPGKSVFPSRSHHGIPKVRRFERVLGGDLGFESLAGPRQNLNVPRCSDGGENGGEMEGKELEDILKIVDLLPNSVGPALRSHPQLADLLEVVMDLGRIPLARFPTGDVVLSDNNVKESDLDYAVSQVGEFGGDNRAGIERTLHRISCIRNRDERIIGLTCRVGRDIRHSAGTISDLIFSGSSVLLLGRPGVGKTTVIRGICRTLADECQKRVVIVDTSNEIGGDGDVPHPGVGRARRMQVPHPDEQHRVMIEAVENHMPEVIVIDEIGTELECLAARTIAQRGVQLIATAHGTELENVIKNPSLQDLIGGISNVTLGDDEARRRGVQKTVLERSGPPAFDCCVEMLDRNTWRIHLDLAEGVDTILAGGMAHGEIRTRNADGQIVTQAGHTAHSRPPPPTLPLVPDSTPKPLDFSPKKSKIFTVNNALSLVEPLDTPPQESSTPNSTSRQIPPDASRPSSQISAFGRSDIEPPPNKSEKTDKKLNKEEPSVSTTSTNDSDNPKTGLKQEDGQQQGGVQDVQYADVQSVGGEEDWFDSGLAGTGQDESVMLRLFLFGVDSKLLWEVLGVLQLRGKVLVTPDVREANAVLATRSKLKQGGWVRQAAQAAGVPLLALKSSAPGQLVKALQTFINFQPSTSEASNVKETERSKDTEGDDSEGPSSLSRGEEEALEEVRLAVEEIVIPRCQPIELLPRLPNVIKLQVELVHAYNLTCTTVGSGNNMRVRILPSQLDDQKTEVENVEAM